MTEPLHPQVAILNAALELPARQRAAYLDSACSGNADLRERVEELLRAHEAAGGFLEAPPPGLDFKRTESLKAPLTEKPGDRTGRYKLLQQIGEGGYGVVYLAEQEEPVRRRVALKVIKLGMDTKQVIARFEAERQALAMMDHPNIARVLDAGTTETGRPYFVMELVRGVKITEFCDENGLSTQDRLNLFIQVCQAIQHAHQKGIIHRDIKPSNILVTVNDGVPVPKAIDFGIAKATQGRLTDQTVFTAFEQFIGTPAYMSPEQAAMTSQDIDTRSDIYSLGVLLYELLTGRTPFDQKELLAAGPDEMRRTICGKEPLKPSTRLTQELVAADVRRLHSKSEVRDAKSEAEIRASSRRLLQMKETVHALRGDLDWIVMKCLEKDRARRYETANGLARDIERHLQNEPVTARPPSALYQFRKLVRRNRLAFVAAGVLAVALTIVAIGSTVAAWRVAGARRTEQAERQRAEAANRGLRHTVSLLEFERAEGFFQGGDAGTGVAHLAAMLRQDPSNRVAASRLISALVHRNWALETPLTMLHADRIDGLHFSPDGRQLLSVGRDNSARIWDAASAREVAVLRHVDQVFCARYNSGGTRIVTASADGTARIWDGATGEIVTPPLQHTGRVYWAEFSPDDRWVVTASADRAACIWDAATGRRVRELRRHTSHVVLARFSPDGQRLATGGSHGSIRIWNAESGEMLFRVEDRDSPLVTMAFSPDGSRLFSLCADEAVRLWNLETRAEIELSREIEPISDAAFSPDSRFLLTVSRDATARIWDVNTGLPIGSPMTHNGGVVSGQFSSDGERIVTLSRDHSARIWDTSKRLPLCQPIRASEEFKRADFSRDGTRLATGGRDGTIRVWNVRPRQFAGIPTRLKTAITTLVFSRDGNWLLATSFDGTACVLDTRTGDTLAVLPPQPGLYLAEFSPDANRVLTAQEGGHIQWWDWRKGIAVGDNLQHPARVRSVHFNPGGDRVVLAAFDGTLRVWEPGMWRPITPPISHRGVLTARFSPDGRWVVSAGEDDAARVWDATTGEPVVPPLLHKDHVRSADFSPDGKRIVTASTDDTACVWDLRPGPPVIPPLQHARIVYSAQFSGDGCRVITASLDRTARIWDTRTGGALTPPLKHDYSLVNATFTRDGAVAMTGCWNGALRAWDSATGQPLTESLETSDWIPRLVALDPVGRVMAAGGQDSIVRLWHLPSHPVPVPEWFLALAESIAGLRLGARGQIEFVPPAAFESAMGAVESGDGNDFYIRLARWFLADPVNRPAPPF